MRHQHEKAAALAVGDWVMFDRNGDEGEPFWLGRVMSNPEWGGSGVKVNSFILSTFYFFSPNEQLHKLPKRHSSSSTKRGGDQLDSVRAERHLGIEQEVQSFEDRIEFSRQ